jgi:tetratricopeptide (TPR) repeat protein
MATDNHDICSKRGHPGWLFIVSLVLLAQVSFAAIWLAQISGTCFDAKGQPLVGAEVRFRSPLTGRNFKVTTDANGTFFYIAAFPDFYDVQVLKKGKLLSRFERLEVRWSSRPLLMEFDLAQGTAKITFQTIAPEVFSTMDMAPKLPESIEGQSKDLATVKAINEKLAMAKSFGNQGDWQGAIDILRAAAETDPARDLPWALLGNAYWNAALKSPQTSEAALEQSVQAYERAISLRPVGAYYNNLGQAYAKLKRPDEAVMEFRKAAKLDPEHRAAYEFNTGAVFFNEMEKQENPRTSEYLQKAIDAFGEVTSLNPQNDEAHYLKGICLLRRAASSAGNASYSEVVIAFRRYLELAPGGRYAGEVKSMLQGLESMK